MTPRPNSIVLTGQGRWVEIIATGLKEYADLQVGVASFDHVSDAFRLSNWRRLLCASLAVRIGFRPGSRTWRGRAFDTAFRMLKLVRPGLHVAYYWIGTDVLNLTEDRRAGALPQWLDAHLAASRHCAVSEGLVAKLATCGIRADLLVFPFANMPSGSIVPSLPERFTVLTYIPDARSYFYGAPQILDVARRLPDVRFRVLGGHGSGTDTPPNVEYLGWQSPAAKWFVDASCVVRMVEHDGAGGTVLEALAFGRPAIYSNDVPGVIYVPYGDTEALRSALLDLHQKHVDGTLAADAARAQATRRTYAPERCWPRLGKWLLEAAKSRPQA